MSINWEHPDVHALILQKLQNDPGALTQAQIAERASIILQRKIQPTNIQRRLTSLKNKLQNQENVSTTARLAPYTKNPPKQQKTVSDMSNRSLLGKIDEAFTELKNRINIEDVGIADSVTKQASSNLDSFFASPVRPKDGFVWEFNGLEAEKRKAEYKEGENVKCREGLNSKLNTCILVDEDNYTYEFSYSHERDGVKYYKCKDCRSSGKTTYLRIYMNGEAKMANHCEDCNPRTCIDTEVLQADRRCRLDASEGKKAYDAYMNTYATLKDAKLDTHYQPYWYYRRQLGRWRQQNFPTSQLGSTDEKYRKLYGCNTGWLDYEDENVAVFCTDRSYRILANCRIIVGDATFSTSPKGVYQTFYIHGFVENDKGGEWIPLLMALMKKKEKKYYQVVVEKIKEAWQRLQVEPRIQRFHLDYEAAEDDAMKNLVGEDKVYGCLFHYNQIIIRRLGKKLYQAYCMKRGKTNIPYYRSIRSWIRCILALPLLPHDDAIYLWNTVLHQIPKRPQTVAEKLWPTAELEEMKEYMQKNWIERTDKMWRFYGLGRTKNTNVAEAFHSLLKRRYDSTLSISEFLDKLQLEFTKHDTRITQVTEMNMKLNPRNPKYVRLEAQLEKLEEEYSDSIVNENLSNPEKVSIMYRFCRKASFLLHDIRNQSGNTKKSDKKCKNMELRKQADDSLIWKQDLNFDTVESLMDVINQTEETMIENGEIVDDFVDETDIYFAPSDAWLRDRCIQLGLDFVNNVSQFRHAIQDIRKFKLKKPDDIIAVDADGHCGFRALSVLLCGDESYHGEVRAAVCSFIAEDISIDETKHIFTNARAIAAAKLQINTSQPIMDRRYWMNDADLAAAAALLQCNIFVYNIDKHWQLYSPDTYQYGTMLQKHFKPELPTLLMDNSDVIVDGKKQKRSANHFTAIVNVRK